MDSKNGVVETYHDNGKLKSRANYKNGKLNGLYESWYDNGQPMSRVNYNNDKLDGLVETWYSDGQQGTKETYKDGVTSIVYNRHKQNMVGQESDRNILEEESL